jgi:hypothetical protein
MTSCLRRRGCGKPVTPGRTLEALHSGLHTDAIRARAEAGLKLPLPMKSTRQSHEPRAARRNQPRSQEPLSWKIRQEADRNEGRSTEGLHIGRSSRERRLVHSGDRLGTAKVSDFVSESPGRAWGCTKVPERPRLLLTAPIRRRRAQPHSTSPAARHSRITPS